MMFYSDSKPHISSNTLLSSWTSIYFECNFATNLMTHFIRTKFSRSNFGPLDSFVYSSIHYLVPLQITYGLTLGTVMYTSSCLSLNVHCRRKRAFKPKEFYIRDEARPFKCPFSNANDSILKLVVSIASGVSLWYRPFYKRC